MSATRAKTAKKKTLPLSKGGSAVENALPPPPSDAGGIEVTLSPLSVEQVGYAVADGIARVLRDIGPKLARLAAADTLHTMEQPKTVLCRAIEEGANVSDLLTQQQPKNIQKEPIDK